MENKKIWKWCFITSIILTIVIYGFFTILAFYPSFSESFDNFFGTNFVFSGNPKGMLQFAAFQSLIAIPGATCLLRFVIYMLEESDYEE